MSNNNKFTKEYWEFVKNMKQPISLSDMSQRIKLREMVKYADKKGRRHPIYLTEEEKKMFVYNKDEDRLFYKEYVARICYVPEDKLYVGEVLGIDDSLSFHTSKKEALQERFENCIKEYLDLCNVIGKKPETSMPFSLCENEKSVNEYGTNKFYTIKSITALPGYVLLVSFDEGALKEYDLTHLIETNEIFKPLKDNLELYYSVRVDVGGYGVFWNEDIDISCNELYVNGKEKVELYK